MKRLLLSALTLLAFSSYGQVYKVNSPGAHLYNSNVPPFTKIATLSRGEPVELIEKKTPTTYKIKYKDKTGFIDGATLVEADKYFEDSQNAWHSTPIRKDNQVMGVSSTPVAAAYKAVYQYLIENNFNIEKADDVNFYLTATAPWGNGGISNGQYRLNIFLKAEDSTRTYVQGTYDASVNGLLLGPNVDFSGILEYAGAKSIPGQIFGKMSDMCKSVPNAAIRYRKKPKS